jgi:uncharacterized protein
MILDLERVSSDDRSSGDEVVVFRDVAGEENRIQCHIEVGLRRTGDTFYIHIDLSGTFSTACHRCLEPTAYKVTPSFDLVVQKADPRAKPEAEPSAEDFVRLPAGQNRLSLDEYVYENLVVNIPMQIFCRDECRGLCSGCGVNLNRETCKCSVSPDARWDELRKIKDKLSE